MGACMSKEEANIVVNSATLASDQPCLHAPFSSPSSSISSDASSSSKKKKEIASIPLKDSSPHQLHHPDSNNSNALCCSFIIPPSPIQRSDMMSMRTVHDAHAHSRSAFHSPSLQKSPTNCRPFPLHFITTPSTNGSGPYAHRSSHESVPQKKDLGPFLTRSKSFTHQPCINTENPPYPLQSKSTHSTFNHSIYPHPVMESSAFRQNLAIAGAETFDESSLHQRPTSFCNELAFGKPRIGDYPNRQPRRMKRLRHSRESCRSLSPSPRYYNNLSFDAASSLDFHYVNGSLHPDDHEITVPVSRKRRVKELGGSPARSRRDALVFLQRSPSNIAFKNQDHLLMYPPTNINHKANLLHQRGSSIKNKVSQNQEAQERRNVLSELPANCCDQSAHVTRSYYSKQKLYENLEEDLMDRIAINAYKGSNYSARSSLDSSACTKSGTEMKDSYVWKRFDENCEEAALSKVQAFQRQQSSTRRKHSCTEHQLHLPLHVQGAENNGMEFDSKWERKESMASSISKACSFWEAVVDHHMANLNIGSSTRIIRDHSTLEDSFMKHPIPPNKNINLKRGNLHLKEAAKEAFAASPVCYIDHSINGSSPHPFQDRRVYQHVSPLPQLNRLQTEMCDLDDTSIDENLKDVSIKVHESCTLAASDA